MFWSLLAFGFHLIDPSFSSPEEQAYLAAFPIEQYKIYQVAEMNRYYLDDPPDTIKDLLKQNIAWETLTSELILKYAKPGSIAIDLGAHIGTQTLFLSRAVGPEGHVYAFEPQWKIFRELVWNLSLNDCNNVTALRCAVGDTNRTVQLDPLIPENEGARTIGKGTETAPLRTLDSFGFKNVSMIKIDVENYEEKVLNGARETILRDKPIMHIEILGHKQKAKQMGINDKHKTRAIIQQIKALGYTIQESACDYLALPIEVK